MLKIGDFSKFGRISVRMLRYYDELGLLRPEQVDPFTGYRYYSADQLLRLNQISALKDLGLSLEQIAELLRNDWPAGQLKTLLSLKRLELQQQIAESMARLERIEARLNQLEREDTMPTYEVTLKRLEPQRVAALRRLVSGFENIQDLLQELKTDLGRQGIKPTGPALMLHYDTEYQEQHDIEVAYPVVLEAVPASGLKIHELEGVETAACLIHHGRLDSLGPAYSTLLKWVEANAYQAIYPDREVYLQTDQPETAVVEIQLPVRKE